jgi:hypothetical protein
MSPVSNTGWRVLREWVRLRLSPVLEVGVGVLVGLDGCNMSQQMLYIAQTCSRCHATSPASLGMKGIPARHTII